MTEPTVRRLYMSVLDVTPSPLHLPTLVDDAVDAFDRIVEIQEFINICLKCLSYGEDGPSQVALLLGHYTTDMSCHLDDLDYALERLHQLANQELQQTD